MVENIAPVPFKFWLLGGYVVKFHVDPEQFEDANLEFSGRMQQGMDIPVGNRAEHDASLWSIGEHQETLIARLPDVFTIPNNKVLTYSLG